MNDKMLDFFENNRVPWSLLTDEEKTFAGPILRKWWTADTVYGEFIACSSPERTILEHVPAYSSVYRLKPEYRVWLKSQQEPEYGWVEVDVREVEGEYLFSCGERRLLLLDAASRLVGFGGIKHEPCECRKELPMPWMAHMPEPCPKHGPQKPIKVRFWRKKDGL